MTRLGYVPLSWEETERATAIVIESIRGRITATEAVAQIEAQTSLSLPKRVRTCLCCTDGERVPCMHGGRR